MSEPHFLPYRFVSGTLGASAFVAITQLVTRSELPPVLYAATICFAVTVPCMAAFYFYPPTFRRKDGRWPLAYSAFHVVYVVTLLAGFAGFALLFFSFGWWPGSAFVVAIIVANKLMLVGSANRAHEEGFM